MVTWIYRPLGHSAFGPDRVTRRQVKGMVRTKILAIGKAKPNNITNPPTPMLVRGNEGVVKVEGVPTWTGHPQNGLFTNQWLHKATLYLCGRPGPINGFTKLHGIFVDGWGQSMALQGYTVSLRTARPKVVGWGGVAVETVSEAAEALSLSFQLTPHMPSAANCAPHNAEAMGYIAGTIRSFNVRDLRSQPL